MQQALGWLRCGSCQHVFDSTGRVVAADVIPTLTDRVNVGAPQLGRVELERLLHKESPAPVSTPPEEPAAPAAPVEPSPFNAFEEALQSFKLPDVPAVPAAPAATLPEDEALPPADPSATVASRPAPAARPRAKAWGWAVAMLLALVIAQLLFAWRGALLTHWPQGARLAAQWCSSAACRAQWQVPLSVWSLKVSPLVMEGSGYRLSWSLTHGASVPLSVPALELALLDAQGQVLSVQALAPAVTAAPTELAPGQIWQGSLPVAWAPGLDAHRARLRLVTP